MLFRSDAAVPFSVPDSDTLIRAKMVREIEKLDPSYRVVLTIDREGVVNELER